MIYLYFILNVLFFSKKRFFRPSQKKYLIVNGDHAEEIKKFLKNSEVNIVYNRFFRGIERDSEINLFVLFFRFNNRIFKYK